MQKSAWGQALAKRNMGYGGKFGVWKQDTNCCGFAFTPCKEFTTVLDSGFHTVDSGFQSLSVTQLVMRWFGGKVTRRYRYEWQGPTLGKSPLRNHS